MSLTLALSEDYLMDAPLPQLLTATGVEMAESSITDREFFGAVVERKNGELVLTMPTGRSELEHDTVARYLIAQALDITVPAMPVPLVTTNA